MRLTRKRPGIVRFLSAGISAITRTILQISTSIILLRSFLFLGSSGSRRGPYQRNGPWSSHLPYILATLPSVPSIAPTKIAALSQTIRYGECIQITFLQFSFLFLSLLCAVPGTKEKMLLRVGYLCSFPQSCCTESVGR